MLPGLLLACSGGGGAGGNQFTGTVKGNSLLLQSALLVGGAEVWLSNTKDLCPKLVANQFPRNGAFVKLTFQQSLATGTFNVPNPASLQFFKLDADCKSTLAFGDSIATKGTVTVARYEADKLLEASFEATFGSSDMTSGSFIANFCDAPTLYPNPTCAD